MWGLPYTTYGGPPLTLHHILWSPRVVTWESHLSLAFSVLALACGLWVVKWSMPAAMVKWANSLDFRIRDAEKQVQRFAAEYLERKAAQEGFESRCEEILDAATSKQRRAAASASRAERSAASPANPQTPSENPPPAQNEAELLAWCRQKAGLN